MFNYDETNFFIDTTDMKKLIFRKGMKLTNIEFSNEEFTST